jgi:DNA-binding MarR family transcriptional regulator
VTDIHPLSEDIGFLLTRVSALMMDSANKALASFDMRVRSYSVLVLACERDGGLGQRQIAQRLGLDPSQIVALVDDLEGRGYLSRQVDPDDRRNKRVEATDLGRAVCTQAQHAVNLGRADVLDGLPAGVDVTALRGALRAVVEQPREQTRKQAREKPR